jgi:AraC-like DNA-binding protein
MRNSSLDPYEDIPRSVVVTANEYPPSFTFLAHSHRRGQFAFASHGAITLATPEGNWLIPPLRGCWVPAGVVHEMMMSGRVTMLNTFVSTEAAQRAELATECGVYGVSPLLRRLLEDAVDLPALYDEDGRDGKLMALLVAEIAAMPQLSLNAPLPRDPRLARVCRRVFEEPLITFGLETFAAEAGMSRRSFTRLFRAQTGVSFGEWRQQVCLLAAIERLSLGQSVTQVALDLGYSSPSAFTAAFRRVLGEAPSHYVGTLGG